jgi:hypothetical protein
MDDTERELRDLLQERLGSVPAATTGAALRGRVMKRRMANGMALVAGLCVLVLVGVTAWRAMDDRGHVVRPAEEAVDDDSPAREALRSLPQGWTELPEPPLALYRGVSLWTGSELIYWGGHTYDGTETMDGATYRPERESWARMAQAPPELNGGQAVWTDREMLVWGPGERGAAYDPKSDTWRLLPPAPIEPRMPSAVAWTGREFVVWGDRERAASAMDGAAYDPASNAWRAVADAPFPLNSSEAVWTGNEMIVFGSHLDGRNVSDVPHARALAFDPAADSWREIPIPQQVRLSPQASSIAWMGTEMIAWDYETKAVLLDPSIDHWKPTGDELPFRFSECYPESAETEGMVFATFCSQNAIYDSARAAWVKLEHPKPLPESIEPQAVAIQPAGAEGIFLVPGSFFAGHDGEAVFWAFKP